MAVNLLDTFIKPMHREGIKFVAIFAAVTLVLFAIDMAVMDSKTAEAQAAHFTDALTDIADAAEACGILDYALSLIDRGCVEAGLPGYPRPWRDRLLLGVGA